VLARRRPRALPAPTRTRAAAAWRSPPATTGQGLAGAFAAWANGGPCPGCCQTPALPRGSVLVATVAVHVAVGDLLGRGGAHINHVDVELQGAPGHRMVEVDVDHAHADLEYSD